MSKNMPPYDYSDYQIATSEYNVLRDEFQEAKRSGWEVVAERLEARMEKAADVCKAIYEWLKEHNSAIFSEDADER